MLRAGVLGCQIARCTYEEITGGTLFLDNAEALERGLQAAIAGLIVDQKVGHSVASTRSQTSYARYFCWHRKRLGGPLQKGVFWPDFYYRLPL